MQKDSLFYIQKEIEDKIINSNNFYKKIQNLFYDFRKKNNVPIYIVNKVLSKIDEEYSEEIENELDKICVVLIPGYFPLILRTNYLKEEIFADFKEEFFASINSIADKFNFSKNDCLGKITKWKKFFKEILYKDLDSNFSIDTFKINDFEKERKVKILISLIIDSQNEAERVCKLDDKSSALEKVKKRIRLFDAEQTRFLYNEPNKKVLLFKGFLVVEKQSYYFIK